MQASTIEPTDIDNGFLDSKIGPPDFFELASHN